jgi:predicted P-loop ATPase
VSRPLWLVTGDVAGLRAHLRADVDVLAMDCTPAEVKGRDVLLWRPAEVSGRTLAAEVAQRLLGNGSAPASFKMVLAPDGWEIATRVASDPALWTFEALQGLADAKAREVVLDVPHGTIPAKQPKIEPGLATTEDGTAAYLLWESLGLARNNNGPYATEANALLILQAHRKYAGKIWLDEFAQRLMIDTDDGPVQMDEIRMIQAQIWIQQALQLPKMPLQAIERAARMVGDIHRRHPVRDWLKGLTWDREERLPTLMTDGFGAAQNEYTAAVGRCWLTAMVARVMRPGCQADYMPVFEGEQGIRKSTAMRILGGDWFTESSEDPINGRKDFLLSLQGKWLVEIPEMHSIASKFSGVEKIKAIISIRVDSYRVPYGKSTMDYPRQCNFVGTTNSPEWNADPSGGRRFWPIACGAINLDYLTEQRDQLFAEAVHRFTIGELWYDVPHAQAQSEQEQRRQRDEWESVIERYITESPERFDHREVFWRPREKPLDQLAVSDLLELALGIPPGRWTRSDQMRVAASLQALGWRKVRLREGEMRINAYRRSTWNTK